MRTPLCDLFGIEFPIFAFTHCRDVAAAVSRAGGLGVLGIAGLTAEELDRELLWLDEAVGGAPYGVDVLIPAAGAKVEDPGTFAARIPDQHRLFVEDLLERYGVPPLVGEPSEMVPATDSMRSASLVDVALGHKISLIASALGPPPPEMVEAAHERGVQVAALVGSAAHAERQRACGVDIIVAQGHEAGGHTGEIATMVLTPEVVDAVAPLPVLAAGGIARGRQIAAALALGAQGVWTGSVWLTTTEAETHPVVKKKYLKATSQDTVRSRATTGKPARHLATAWTAEWEAPGAPAPLPMPLQWPLVREANERIQRAAENHAGARDLITYFVGQVVGSLDRIRPVRDVVFDMVDEYLDTVQHLTRIGQDQ